MNDIQRLQRIYGAAGRELRAICLGPDPANYTEAWAAGASRRAKDLVRVMNVTVERWTSETIPRAYDKSVRISKTTLQILGRRPRHQPAEDRRRRLIDDLAIILLRANNSIPGTVDRYLSVAGMAAKTIRTARVREFEFSQVSDDLSRMAAEAVASEASRGTLSGRIRDYLYDLFQDDRFIEIGGRMYQMKKYAEMVGRTTLRDAQTAATLDLCRQYDNDLVEVSSHGTICDICKPFEGNVYSLSGMDPDYPKLEMETPFHPNCEHSLLPTSVEAIGTRGGRG
jgi:hypothetical protein